jgi:hypothetical protein
VLLDRSNPFSRSSLNGFCMLSRTIRIGENLTGSQDYCAQLNATALQRNTSLSALHSDSNAHIRFIFTPQSSHITFSDWIGLITLALAPLLAHIFVGGPQIVVLGPQKPRWLDVACLYNPTTIVWRYYSIAVRRATATNWTPYDAATANSAFWTSTVWNGSLETAKIARASCTRAGTRCRVRLLSRSAAQTIIVALQAAQTETDLLNSWKHLDSAEDIALPNMFAFVTLLGMYRLLAAPWLVEDFSFADFDDHNAIHVREILRNEDAVSKESTHPGRSKGWRIWAIRILFIGPLTAQIALNTALSIPVGSRGLLYTATRTALLSFGGYIVSTMLCIFGWQMYRKHDTNVVLPSVNSCFYKVYTLSMFAGLLALLVISCLETRRTFCGVYTTIPKDVKMDALTCKRKDYA